MDPRVCAFVCKVQPESMLSEPSIPKKSRTEWLTRIRKACFDHAADLIDAADKVLTLPNIAYHLSILALEEIGKAELITSHEILRDGDGVRNLEKKLEDHAFKLLWAVWSPSMKSAPLTPEHFQEVKRFAENAHMRRKAGLYVDHSTSTEEIIAPKGAVTAGQATAILDLAKSILQLSLAAGVPNLNQSDDLMLWFIETISVPESQARLFSKSFIANFESMDRDVRSWMAWAREEFVRIRVEEETHLKAELSRTVSGDGTPRQKWRMRIPLRSASHTIRPEVLSYWNTKIEAVKLHPSGKAKHDITLEIFLGENIIISEVFDAGLSLSKLIIASINIGSCGFFWYELSGQTAHYFESVVDLDAPNMSVLVGRDKSLSDQWLDASDRGKKRGAGPLEENHLDHALKCMLVFGRMPDKDAAPIFGSYLEALALLSKADIHLSTEVSARELFLKVLLKAMQHFGDWDGDAATLMPTLHHLFAAVLQEKEHMDMVFLIAENPTGTQEGRMADAVSAKRLADLYLVMVANRLSDSPPPLTP